MSRHTSREPGCGPSSIQNLFREFNEGRSPEDRLRPHDLRARAFTVVAGITGSTDDTAKAMGADPQTTRIYVGVKKVYDDEAVLRAAAAELKVRV